MAKRKRSRRHRRYSYHARQKKNYVANDDKENDSLTINCQMRTCAEDEWNSGNSSNGSALSLSMSKPLSPLCTPKHTRSNSLIYHQNVLKSPITSRNHSSIRTTPVNRSKGLGRCKIAESFNCTNLNFLFNCDSPVDSCRIQNDLSENISNKKMSPFPFGRDVSNCNSSPRLVMSNASLPTTPNNKKRRSSSSIAKLHSPGLEKVPIKVHVGTQTMVSPPKEIMKIENEVKEYFEKSNLSIGDRNICETPKLSQAALLDLDFEDKVQYKSPYKIVQDIIKSPQYSTADTKLSKILNVTNNNYITENLKRAAKFSKISSFDKVETNNSPAAAKIFTPPNISEKNNDGKANVSISEMSFFSPDLFDLKSISTPIGKAYTQNKLMETVARRVAKLKESMGDNKPANFIYDSATPKCNEEKEKSLIKGDNLLLHKLNNFDFGRQNANRALTPKLGKHSHHSWNNTSKDVSPKTSSMNTIPKPASPIKHRTFEKSDNILNVSNSRPYNKLLGRVRRFHTRFTTKWTVHLIKICSWLGITIRRGFSSIYGKLSKSADNTEQTNIVLNNTVCKCELYQNQISTLTKRVEGMSSELSEVREQLTAFELLKKELQEIKDQLSSMRAVPPPPPPPPMFGGPPLPPPPPPPLPMNIPTTLFRPNLSRKKPAEKKTSEGSRPVISLDDILKVKLRKTADKPVVTRRCTQPIISTEMLAQIKLRPTVMSRPHTPTSLNEASLASSSLTTSPHTNLTRILTNVDPNVRRVKRLRRVGGYSFDTISRMGRTLSREREKFTVDSASLN